MLGSAESSCCSAPAAWPRCTRPASPSTGLAPRWREARQIGTPPVVEWSEGTFAAALQAAAVGARLVPRGRPGSAPTCRPINPWLKEATDPHTGRAVLAVRALVPDVALIHVTGIDADGNVVRRRGSRRRRAARPRRPAGRRHVRARRPDRARSAPRSRTSGRRRRRGAGRGGPPTGMPARLRRRRAKGWPRCDRRPAHGTLAEEMAAAPIRVFVPTTPATEVAARAAQASRATSGWRSRAGSPTSTAASAGWAHGRVHAAAARAPRRRGRARSSSTPPAARTSPASGPRAGRRWH